MSSPKVNITRYFFGYFRYHGQLMSCTWVEYDGRPIGRVMDYTQRHELTEREWETTTLLDLKLKYPPDVA